MQFQQRRARQALSTKRGGAVASLLNADAEAYLTEGAAEKGIPGGDMVSALLRQKTQVIE